MEKLNINKETMQQETMNFLETLFSLPEVEKVAIKDIEIKSIEDVESIQRGLEECYHDNMSDVDINIWIAVCPQDYDADTPIYRKFFKRLRINERIFGVIFQGRDSNQKEGLRICLKSGFRMDLSCHVRCDETAAPLPRNVICEVDFVKANEFWFISIQALAKLMRKDYLIADHLSHMLLMEGLVLQMVERDQTYQTNFHRYGYAEELAYLDVNLAGYESFFSEGDDTYNHIAENLIRAVLSYDKLVVESDSLYEKRAELFFEIWNCYWESN